MKATKKDMSLRSEIFYTSTPAQLPVSYKIGDKVYKGIPKEFSPKTERRIIDSNITVYTVTGVTEEGLEIRIEYKAYNDFPCTEWVMYIENKSSCNSPSIRDFKVLDGVIKGSAPLLYHGNGDDCTENGYSWWTEKLTSRPLAIFPNEGDGNSCCGAYPFTRLLYKDYAINIAIGWTGCWEASFAACEEGAHVKIGQRSFDSWLAPGEIVRTPSVILFAAFNSPSEQDPYSRIRNLWRSWYMAHILPNPGPKALGSKLVLHTFCINDLPEFCGTTEDNQKQAIDIYVKNGMVPDIWWIDAGWYPCNNNWPTGTGNFFVNSDNFPNGLKPVSDKCHEHGIELLLWFEPERIYKDSWVYKNKPQYLLAHPLKDDPWWGNNFLYNLGDKEACDWLIDTIDSFIKENGVDIYRQDFNFPPAVFWKTYSGEGREGIMENFHIQGYYRYWDTLIERNPGLWIDSCSSGGRRNDIETLKRAVPLHYTDVGYGKHPIKQGQYRQLLEWAPYFRSHTMAWDDENGNYTGVNRPVDEFSYLSVMTIPAITSMIEYYHPEPMQKLGVRMNEIWRRTADLSLRADYYPLTECRKSDEDWYVSQFDDPDTKTGMLHFIRNIKAPDESITVSVFVDPANFSKTYTLEDTFTGKVITLSGEELANGFTYSAPKRGGTVFIYNIQ